MSVKEPYQLRGIVASAGYAIGKAVIMRDEAIVPEQRIIEDVELEQQRLQDAVAVAESELELLYQQTIERLGENKAEIFAGHILLVKDPELLELAMSHIRNDNASAEYAWYEAARFFIETLRSMDDELMQARAADLNDVSDRVLRLLTSTGRRSLESMMMMTVTDEVILFAEDLTPSDTANLDMQVVKGIVNRIGSRTSHSAIMARSVELPAVVGVQEDWQSLSDGDLVILDGIDGVVIVHPTGEMVANYREKLEDYEANRERLKQWVDRTTVSRDGRSVELAVNIGKLDDLDSVLANGAEGVGLFRTEFLFMAGTRAPTEEEQVTIYSHVLQKMGDKPVVIRTLDIGGDKDVPYMQLSKEANPFLGRRGLRLCLAEEAIFRTQISALLRASVHGNLKIMFPMIALVEEWRQAKAILLEEKARLEANGVVVSDRLEVGMMIEVPAAALAARVLASEVDFFSIGTNDLIQYTMAADRMNDSVAYLYQPLHPTILYLIKLVVDAAHSAGKWVGMCGAMAEDPDAILLLLGLGLDELSMSASYILPARQRIAELSYEELREVATRALRLSSEDEVRELARSYVR